MAGGRAVNALGQVADEYVQLRRALGHKMDHAARLLPEFVVYLESIQAETVTVANALTWAQTSPRDPAPASRAQRMAVARGFARYLAGIDPRTEVPPPGLLPYPKRRRAPFIFSADDIAALMAEARRLTTSFRAATYETLVGLLVVTGMRVGEAIRLGRNDVDFGDGVLVVRFSKFGKSREVPFHTSTTNALAIYARRRDERWPHPKAPNFFVSQRGTPLLYEAVQRTFHQLLARAGIGAQSAVGPRIHDLRHSFAVHTLVNWYRDGKDVHAWLPRLSTYLGHRDPRFTYRYLSAAPELLALAAGRLEAAAGCRP
jgi:integrase/recombinase XerD